MQTALQDAQGLGKPPGNCRCGSPEETLCAEVLACLSSWPAPPPAVERRPAAAAASHSWSQTDSDGDADAEYRPRKLRLVVAEGFECGGRERKPRAVPAPGAAAGLLQRRTYTWRGISSRRAEKQQRQLDALQQQAAAAVPAAAHSNDSANCAAGAATLEVAAAAAAAAAVVALEEASSCKEGARAWAALTTWLRMNIHNARTAKKAVLFVGRRHAASGRWSFGLNPALSWADVSPETRQRLRHLPQEAAQAFRSKYPSRPPGDWRIKSQKYKPPGTAQTSLVLLEDLVLSLHAVWQAHEGAAAVAAPAAAAPAAAPPATAVAAAGAASSDSAASAAGAAAGPELDSCGSSPLQLAAPVQPPSP